MKPPSPDALLEVHDLELRIGERLLISGLDLSLRPGESLGLLGQNGSGKTTLLHSLIRLHTPDRGHIHLAGQELRHWRGRALARQVGILFQQQQDEMPATVMETVMLGRFPHLAPWRWEESRDLQLAHQALSEMGLGSLGDRQVQSLSGGERQRLALAALLTQDPALMLLDEPANHLDIAHQISALTRLRDRLAPDRALIMASHDINLAARFCDRILLLDGRGGHLLGAADQILSEDKLSRIYGHPIRAITVDGQRYFHPA